MAFLSKYKMRISGLIMAVCVLIGTVTVIAQQRTPAKAASDYDVSWGGTSSSMSGANHQWVQDFINGCIIEPDGTIKTSSGWDEAHAEHQNYKDGHALLEHPWDQNGVDSNSSRSIKDTQGRTWTIPNPTFTGGKEVKLEGSSVSISGDSSFSPNALKWIIVSMDQVKK